MFKNIKDKFGRLDVLFNNAGVAPNVPLPFHEVPMDVVNETIKINQIGAWHVLK